MSQAAPPPQHPHQAPPAFPPPPPLGSAPTSAPARPRRTGFAVAVLTGALVVGGAAGLGGAATYAALAGDEGASDSGQGGTSSISVADTPDSPPADGSVESVASTVLPSVVKLDVGTGQNAGSGSGVVLDGDGLILTNAHVVTLGGAVEADQAEITASFADGTEAPAEVVGVDPLTDTALVRVSDVDDLTPITVGKSGDLAVGEQVVAVGSPYGLDSTVTSGIVSALDRPVGVGRDAEGNTTAYPAIQTDAAINPGNSGGALVDMNGHLVGINASIRTAGSTAQGASSGSIGLGFSIPIDDVLPIVEELEAGKPATHARLGIEVSDVGATSGGLGGSGGSGASVAVGAQIQNVSDGSAAGDAGLQDGDVITKLDDRKVTGADDLVALVRAYRPGDTVTVTYVRGDEEQTTELELGSDADSAGS